MFGFLRSHPKPTEHGPKMVRRRPEELAKKPEQYPKKCEQHPNKSEAHPKKSEGCPKKDRKNTERGVLSEFGKILIPVIGYYLKCETQFLKDLLKEYDFRDIPKVYEKYSQ